MQERDAGATHENVTALEAQVNAPAVALVALYHPDGRAINVPEAAVEPLVRDGWSRESNDIPELANQLALLFDSAKGAVAAYAEDAAHATTLTVGVESATFVAEHAMDDLVVAWGRLHRAVHTRLPIEQVHGGVAMRVTKDDPWNKAGDVIQVDESQVDAYTRDRGYELVGQEGTTNAG
jgi:hypothetical protein